MPLVLAAVCVGTESLPESFACLEKTLFECRHNPTPPANLRNMAVGQSTGLCLIVATHTMR